jgi:hypothetical protein
MIILIDICKTADLSVPAENQQDSTTKNYKKRNNMTWGNQIDIF